MSDITSRLSDALADRYAIERELGAGGMATVYLAQDLKHDRKVALKVLRPELAAVLGAERFVQEIKTTAALQHPHILPLFDSGRVGGWADERLADSEKSTTAQPSDRSTAEFLFYVMPYIEGETLRDKLTRETQLSIDEAVKITTEVADALNYAHRHGVIHRDIKPENILLHDGRPMVADFGIALAVSAAAGGRMTETGMSLGTPHYMSPEQATADKDITARSDVYSLGSVLYEMLTGSPPHVGASAQQIIMKIVTENAAPVTELRKSVPPNVAAAVAKSLEKLPADRFDSAKAFADALTNPAFITVAGAEGRPVVPSSRRPIALAVLATIAIVTTALAAWGWLRPAPKAGVVRVTVALPAEQQLARVGSPKVAVSPDGSSFVYPGSVNGRQVLLLRSLDRLEAEPLAGTEGGVDPFFSPDGKWLAFFSSGKLRKVSLTGSPPLALADAGTPRGGAWSDDGHIYFTPTTAGGLMRVGESGGPVERATTVDSSGDVINHRWPDALPDGRGILFTGYTGNLGDASVEVADRDGKVRRLIDQALMPRYLPTGYLAFVNTDGALLAVRFDLGALDTIGPVVTVLEGVSVDASTAGADLSIARNGTLAYVAGGSATALVRTDREGTEVVLEDSLRAAEAIRASPDGRRLVMGIEEGGGMSAIVYDLQRRSRTRLTFSGTARYPTWSPAGDYVLFGLRNDTTDGLDLYEAAADGSGGLRLVYKAPFDQYEGEWLPNRRGVAMRQTVPTTGRDLWMVPLPNGEPQEVLRTTFNERSIALAPDGHHLAYVSDESGIDEVYIRDFPGPGGKWQVSQGGGTEPAWRGDGKELYYRGVDDIMSVPIETGLTFRPGIPRRLFRDVYARNPDHPNYGVSPSGESFYFARSTAGDAELVLVLNWFQEIKQ